MPTFELTSPEGKKYRVEGPEGATQEQAYGILQKQLAAESGNTRGGDLARGLLHGATMGLAGDAPPEGASGWRQTGETIGNLGTSAAAGFIPGGMAVKGLVGTGVGAMQPAGSMTERLENAAIGGGSALTGGLIGKMPKGAKTALDRLAEMGIGFSAGRHLGLGEWGPFAGLYAGRMIGREAERMFGGRGLGDLVAAIGRNPGLAAYLGIKSSPYAQQAGQWAGEQLGKPSQ
jgi:hypothetical protein